MAIDAIFKIPAQLSPTKKKKPTLSDLAAESRVRACGAAVAALGVGSSLEAPSATAVLSPPAARCNRLKDMGE